MEVDAPMTETTADQHTAANEEEREGGAESNMDMDVDDDVHVQGKEEDVVVVPLKDESTPPTHFKYTRRHSSPADESLHPHLPPIPAPDISTLTSTHSEGTPTPPTSASVGASQPTEFFTTPVHTSHYGAAGGFVTPHLAHLVTTLSLADTDTPIYHNSSSSSSSSEEDIPFSTSHTADGAATRPRHRHFAILRDRDGHQTTALKTPTALPHMLRLDPAGGGGGDVVYPTAASSSAPLQLVPAVAAGVAAEAEGGSATTVSSAGEARVLTFHDTIHSTSHSVERRDVPPGIEDHPTISISNIPLAGPVPQALPASTPSSSPALLPSLPSLPTPPTLPSLPSLPSHSSLPTTLPSLSRTTGAPPSHRRHLSSAEPLDFLADVAVMGSTTPGRKMLDEEGESELQSGGAGDGGSGSAPPVLGRAHETLLFSSPAHITSPVTSSSTPASPPSISAPPAPVLPTHLLTLNPPLHPRPLAHPVRRLSYGNASDQRGMFASSFPPNGQFGVEGPGQGQAQGQALRPILQTPSSVGHAHTLPGIGSMVLPEPSTFGGPAFSITRSVSPPAAFGSLSAPPRAHGHARSVSLSPMPVSGYHAPPGPGRVMYVSYVPPPPSASSPGPPGTAAGGAATSTHHASLHAPHPHQTQQLMIAPQYMTPVVIGANGQVMIAPGAQRVVVNPGGVPVQGGGAGQVVYVAAPAVGQGPEQQMQMQVPGQGQGQQPRVTWAPPPPSHAAITMYATGGDGPNLRRSLSDGKAAQGMLHFVRPSLSVGTQPREEKNTNTSRSEDEKGRKRTRARSADPAGGPVIAPAHAPGSPTSDTAGSPPAPPQSPPLSAARPATPRSAARSGAGARGGRRVQHTKSASCGGPSTVDVGSKAAAGHGDTIQEEEGDDEDEKRKKRVPWSTKYGFSVGKQDWGGGWTWRPWLAKG